MLEILEFLNDIVNLLFDSPKFFAKIQKFWYYIFKRKKENKNEFAQDYNYERVE